jgi:hypothetical protein
MDNVEREPKRHHSVQAARLIHEHFGTVMSFAYSQLPLRQLVNTQFQGEMKYLRRALFEIPEERATRALSELGLYIRVIDDDEELAVSKHYGERVDFGVVVQADSGLRAPLFVREVGNKIIHAERYEWRMSAGIPPTVVCLLTRSKQRSSTGRRHPSICRRSPLFCGSLMG